MKRSDKSGWNMSNGEIVLYSIGAGLLAAIVTVAYAFLLIGSRYFTFFEILKWSGFAFVVAFGYVAGELSWIAFQRDRKDRG